MCATEFARDPGRIWDDLLEGNRRFVAGSPQARDFPRERAAVAHSQHPKAMVLACCDSRVAPEIIFDQRLGDLFVIRSAGNAPDKLAIGSLEFGAEILAIPLLVVVGHQRCGAVKTACSDRKVASPNIKAIVKAVRGAGALPATDADAIAEAEKQNARHVARALLDRSGLLRARADRGELAVIPAYYRLDTGQVERL